MLGTLLSLASVAAVAATPACGGGAASAAPPGGGDASSQATPDGGGPSPGVDAGSGGTDATTSPEAGGGSDGSASAEGGSTGDGSMAPVYPAFTPDVPQVQNQGGPVLAHPVLVTVTWSVDPNAGFFESFGDGLGSTKYWSNVETEYGVGSASSGPTNHVRLTTAPPTSMSDADVVALISANAGSAGWPAPTANTMYVVYLPPGAELLLGGEDACQSVGAYHDGFVLDGQNVAYAAVPQCEGGTGTVTLSASHEIGEGSADPYPEVNPAFLGFDNAHLAWDVFQEFQDEVADACEFYPSSEYMDMEPGFAFTVQRLWSNQSAAAGHNPCIPSDTPTYFNTTLLSPENITVDMHEQMGPSNFATQGVHIAVGETKTFQLGYYSDGPTTGPWTIIAHDGNPVVPSTSTGSHLTIAIDKTTGQNGDIANVTITVNSIGDMNSELLTIESRLGVLPSHWLPILIGSQ